MRVILSGGDTDMKDIRQGIDTEAPVEDIVAILAKHGITIGLIDQVFDRAKNRAINHTIVTAERIVTYSSNAPKREELLLKFLGAKAFTEAKKDIVSVLQNHKLDLRPEIAQDLMNCILFGKN